MGHLIFGGMKCSTLDTKCNFTLESPYARSIQSLLYKDHFSMKMRWGGGHAFCAVRRSISRAWVEKTLMGTSCEIINDSAISLSLVPP